MSFDRTVARRAKEWPHTGELEAPRAPGRTATSALLQRKAGGAPLDSGILQRDGGGPLAHGAEAAVEQAASSGGAPLPAEVRERFEGSLGADLSPVRVHTGAASAEASAAIGARAYATGQDIHFAAGEYDPASQGGLHLLAHEVAHTVQQASGAASGQQAKLTVSSPGDAHEIEADRAADAMVAGAPAAVNGGGAAVMRSTTPADMEEPAEDALPIEMQLALPSPDYAAISATLNKLNMLAMVKKLDGIRPQLPKLLANLPADGSPGTSRIRAAVLAVQFKGTSTEGDDGAAKLKKVVDELAAAKVEIWERVDIAVYLDGAAGPLRKQVLDDLAATIDSRITALIDVELLKPSTEKGTEKHKAQQDVEIERQEILRLVHDYMRLVDAELLVLTGAELTRRQEQKKRFDHFKMMRESEELCKSIMKETDPEKLKELKKRKVQLEGLLAEDMSFRKPVGSCGKHDGRTYVVYEDYVKVGGDFAWINNNPGNMIASTLATKLKNKHAGDFAIFPTMELGFQAIPVELLRWRAEKPGFYTLLETFKRWANRSSDNPGAYTDAIVSALNEAGIKDTNGAKIARGTLLAELTPDNILYMGECMGRKVERMHPGDIYYRSDVAAQPWIGALLGEP